MARQELHEQKSNTSQSLRKLDESADDEQISLCELLDRVLNRGVVLRGDIVITVADVDLLYLGVQLVLSATETARQAGVILPHDMTRTMRSVEGIHEATNRSRLQTPSINSDRRAR